MSFAIRQPYALGKLGTSIWLARRNGDARRISDAIYYAKRELRERSMDMTKRGNGNRARRRYVPILAERNRDTICLADYITL